jgi:LPS-assembly protein
VERAPGKASEDLPPVTAAPLPGAAAPVTHPAADLPPLRLRMAGAMVPPPPESDVPRPVFLSAQRFSGVVDREVVAEDDAELRKVGTVLTGDRLTYWPVDDEVEAAGNVRLQQGDDVISGPQVRFKIEDQVGFIEQASYFVKRQSPGW